MSKPELAEINFKPFGLKKPFPVFRINKHDVGLSQQLKKNGFREPINTLALVKAYKRLDPEKWAILDIGGNIGYFPMIAALTFKGPIIVFEPVKRNYNLLFANVGAFDQVKVVNAAVGDHDGRGWITTTDSLNNCSFNPNVEYFKACGIKKTGFENVRVVGFKEAAKIPRSLFVRCDLEGYEETLFAQVPDNVKSLSFEFHTKILGRSRSFEVLNQLQRQGFKIDLMTRELDGLCRPIKIFGFAAVGAYEFFKERRIFRNPNKWQIEKVVKAEKENPHIFMSRL